MREPVADSPTKAMALMFGVLGDGPPGGLAHAVHHVQHARRQPGIEGDLGEQVRRQRAPFGRLVDHRAAGGQRRGDLPGAQHERGVPRSDHPHRPDGVAGGVVDVVRRRQRQPIGCTGGPVGEEPEVLRTPQGGGAHEPHGLAGVDALGEGDLLRPLDDEVGHPVQDPLALGAGGGAPRLERPSRGPGRGVDVGGVACGHLAERGAVDGGVVGKGCARGARHLLAGHEMRCGPRREPGQVRLGGCQVLLESGGCHRWRPRFGWAGRPLARSAAMVVGGIIGGLRGCAVPARRCGRGRRCG